jgi:hypothetical protein
MLLIAGGQLDPNVGRLLRRILERGVPFRDLLVGPELTPRIVIDVDSGSLELNGEPIAASGCFVRHDVFQQQQTRDLSAHAAALNWFYSIRGWVLAQPALRCFNRHSYLSENNKLENLCLARAAGLATPRTVVTNMFEGRSGELVQKPVAGGDYTTTLAELTSTTPLDPRPYPRFLQPRLHRPELRVYRIGDALLGYALESDEIDYRTTHRARISAAPVPPAIASGLITLCDRLGLDLAAADFMIDPDSRELLFLEVNTQPMFAAFDEVSQGRLCDAIIDHLQLRPA